MNPKKQPPSGIKLNAAEQTLAEMQFLKTNGGDAELYASNLTFQGKESKLINALNNDLFSEALYNALQGYQPPPVPLEKQWFCGNHFETGQPIYLNIDDFTGHVILAGSTKTGKNNLAYILIGGLVQHGVKVNVFAQKGDEGELADIYPNVLWLPIEKDPTNDLNPIF